MSSSQRTQVGGAPWTRAALIASFVPGRRPDRGGPSWGCWLAVWPAWLGARRRLASARRRKRRSRSASTGVRSPSRRRRKAAISSRAPPPASARLRACGSAPARPAGRQLRRLVRRLPGGEDLPGRRVRLPGGGVRVRNQCLCAAQRRVLYRRAVQQWEALPAWRVRDVAGLLPGRRRLLHCRPFLSWDRQLPLRPVNRRGDPLRIGRWHRAPVRGLRNHRRLRGAVPRYPRRLLRGQGRQAWLLPRRLPAALPATGLTHPSNLVAAYAA